MQFAGFLEVVIAAMGDLGWPARQRYLFTERYYRSHHGRFTRLLVRAGVLLVYPFQLIIGIRRAARGTVHIVTTNPFYAPLLAFCARRRDQRIIQLVYDLYPHTFTVSGANRIPAFVVRTVSGLVGASFRRVPVNVFLTEPQRDAAQESFAVVRQPLIIPVGADDRSFRDRQSDELDVAEKEVLELLYCGNLGHLHDVDTLIEALDEVLPELPRLGVRLRFHAHGAACKRLRQAHAQTSHLVYGGLLDSAAWIAAMKRAHIGLITMRAGAEQVLMPSKAYSAMMAGQALLAVSSASSEVALMINRHACGWNVLPGDAAGLVALLRSLPARRTEITQCRREALAASPAYAAAATARGWEALLRTAPQSAG